MTKEQLFAKYNIKETHNMWESHVDNWMSVEIYRLMHDGELPKPNDESAIWILHFLDKQDDMEWWAKNVMTRRDWGSLYLTAKRIIYRLAERILKEIQ